MRKRVLIVNCDSDDSHQPLRRTWKMPQAVGPVYLAGAFSPHHCDVRLYDEESSGPRTPEQRIPELAL